MIGFPIKTAEREEMNFEQDVPDGILDFFGCGCGCGGYEVRRSDDTIVCMIGHPKGKHGDHIYEGSLVGELFVWEELAC